MAKPLPTSDGSKSGPKIAQLIRARLQEVAAEPTVEENVEAPPPPREPDPWLVNDAGGESQASGLVTAQLGQAPPPNPAKVSNSVFIQLESLRTENARLRLQVRDQEAAIEELEQASSGATITRMKELEDVIDQKDAVIRELHERLRSGEVVEDADSPEAGPPIASMHEREQEMLALSEELERERKQLAEDEKTVMQQMREMEIQMSRERAEVARQRNEVQRLHNELQHELELAQRDGGLRERLAPLQRRQQDLLGRRGMPQKAAPAGVEPQQAADKQIEDTGASFLGRLFGKK